ncbi:MAG: YwaF family protein [Clostridia bacterium]|nr:YwaF family protein [Clostridia bacterium]
MDFWYAVLSVLNTQATEPVPYGMFHLAWFAGSILLGVLLCRLRPEGEEKFVRRLLLITAVVCLVAEAYRQVHYGFTLEGGQVIPDYRWYIFPFQFCSTPMYVALMAAIAPRGRLHNALCAYLATFALFAGTAVMVYPVTIYTATIGINIGTSICHGSMIMLGIYLCYSGYVPQDRTTLRRAVPVFGVCVLIAMLLNELAHLSGLLSEHTFNMFFISPYCEPSLPVYSIVQQYVDYPFCLVFYILGFAAAAGIIHRLLCLLCRPLRRPGKPYARTFS